MPHPRRRAISGQPAGIFADHNDEPYAHFILSSVPRGGFSGAPVLSEFGFLLGVLTDSLYGNDQPHELGFASAVSVEPLLELIHEYRIECGENLAFARELFGSAGEDEAGS
jgi:hypothetical protein